MLSLAQRRPLGRARRRARLALVCALACLAAASWGAGRSSAAGCPAPSFRPRPVYPLGDDARALAAADFNSDGKLDFVGVSFGVGQITVFLNDGTGAQAVGTNYEAGINPVAVAAADFNGDGKPDLAVADNSPARVAVLINDGAGGFGPTAYTDSGGGSPRWLAPGDFNRDGKVDLAVANEAAGNVAILIGNGAGAFTVGAAYSAGQQPRFVLVSDFNNDAKQDLAVGIIGAAQIFLGDGAGAFTRQPNNCSSIGGDSLAAGDLNGDGRVDLIGGGPLNSNVSIALGSGAGCFGAATSHDTVTDRPRSVHLADFNSDGRLDALTNTTLSLGDGTGRFGPPAQFGRTGEATPPGVWAVVPGDFDGDTKLDVASVKHGPALGQFAHGLTIVFGDGAGGFRFTTGRAPVGLAAADFNKDGRVDLVTPDANSARLSLFLGDGAGGYAPAVAIPAAGNRVPFRIRALDLNGDANPDLVGLQTSPNSVVVLLGNGAGGFSAPTTFALTSGLSTLSFIQLADFNGDGKTDVVVADQSFTINVLLGAGDGSFGPAIATGVGNSIMGLAVADFDADGRPDLALPTFSPSAQNRIAVLLGNGAGGFGAAVSFPSGGEVPRALAAGDFNGDGKADLAVAHFSSATVSLLPGDGAGGLGQPAVFATGPNPESLVVADFNGDGRPDVATASNSGATLDNVSVLLGDGAGRLGPAAHYATEGPASHLLAADLNADGLTDVATASTVGNSFSVLLNSCSGAVSAAAVQFDEPSYSVQEDATTAVITVRRTGDASGDSSVDYATVDDPAAVRCDDVQTKIGVAFARCDYATAVGTVRFAPGETAKTFAVSIINDAHPESDEIVRLVLRGPAGAALGSQNAATLRIPANDALGGQNPIDGHAFFVRQQYLDFLSREPEPSGAQAWLDVLNGCPDAFNHDPAAPSALCDRVTVSSAFFRSQEFQLKGFYVFRFYRASFNRLPRYAEIVPDMSGLAGQTPEEVFRRRAQFADQWVARQEFQTAFGQATNAQLVNALMDRYGLQSIRTPNPQTPDDQNAKITITRQELIDRLNSNAYTRAQAVRAVADSDEVDAAEFRRAFVAMQYFGYLRRDPDEGGFNNWMAYLNANPSDFYTMVNGFLYSQEYRLRFGPAD